MIYMYTCLYLFSFSILDCNIIGLMYIIGRPILIYRPIMIYWSHNIVYHVIHIIIFIYNFSCNSNIIGLIHIIYYLDPPHQVSSIGLFQ